MHIIITESSNGAQAHVGPFETEEAAHAHAQKYNGQKWWIAQLFAETAQTVSYTIFED